MGEEVTCLSKLKRAERTFFLCAAASLFNDSILVDYAERSLRPLVTICLAVLLLVMAACGKGSTPPPTSGPLTGNWQLDLLQEEPRPQNSLSVSGFLVQAENALTGSVQVPPVAGQHNCGGIASVTGTVSGQSVTLSVNEGGTTLNLTGTLSSDGKSMSGDYQGPGGGCFTVPTTGTFNSFLIPPLNGNFTGTISNSTYMTLVTGASPAAPIAVSGAITQSTNADASNATLTGTITAVDYPCFSTALLSGTISGQNVYLNIFGYNGVQIGTLGQSSGAAGVPGSPATVVVGSSGISLVDTSNVGLFLGANTGTGTVGPCPGLIVPGTSNPVVIQTSDSGSVAFNFQ
jgi:hypothetical protein